ncbi:DEAD/DEAH box helicase [Shewanella sp. LC6]|uniref:DEAD/DEAH box helicase n=1 Tax=unclassified Shewanella TaxID=196818 RepID=UPI001127942E|nr:MULTISPECIES: DEAD/DEAH box helicase [unclassified Shewanella]QQK60105.1 DEAD/DEAH box helicase [Shewanella sp. LC6]TPE61535.1 DEAD/DEAH box helicase [Shewanella sp. LC2]
MSKKSISLTNLYTAISSVSVDAVLNQLNFRHDSLRAYLRSVLSSQMRHNDGFLAEPVIEATFGWHSSERSLNDLTKQGELSARLVKCMDGAFAPDTEKQKSEDSKMGKSRLGYATDIDEDYTWPENRAPYTHQLEAWNLLSQDTPRSTVVTSGTGSGKTECFLVPLLNDLAKQVESHDEVLVGVQAIMLYPLNALINSQQERLSAWTRGFEGKIRYALYTGETKHTAPPKATRVFKTHKPEKVEYRDDIRNAPPPILVTNSTILEYMLVRPVDREILTKSQGKLRWIILDEAHTLVGTQAAEISLLLRRTMIAFNVKPEHVRFIATSATIGDSKDWIRTEKLLKEFLSGLAGVSPEQVSVVRGTRYIPKIPDDTDIEGKISIPDLEKLNSADAYQKLCQIPLMRILRQRLIQSPMTVSEIAKTVYTEREQLEALHAQNAMKLIDIATNAYPDGNPSLEPFFPVRAHIFHRAQRGLWACVNPNCCHKTGSELEQGWPFGRVFVSERQKCLDGCSSPVYELTHCAVCKEPSLAASLVIDSHGNRVLLSREHDDLDEYSDEIEDNQEIDVILEHKTRNNVQIFSSQSSDLERYKSFGSSVEAYLDLSTRRVKTRSENTLAVRYTTADRDSYLRCACCDATEAVASSTFKRALLGAPFLMGNLVPELLRHIPRKNDDSLFGARLITFTDSRQGTARFSAKLQLDSERKWCRSKIYREIAMRSSDSELYNDPQIATFNKILDSNPEAATKDFILSQIKIRLEELKKVSFKLNWVAAVELLANTDEIRLMAGDLDVEDYMLPGEYSNRDQRLENTKHLAELFLLREFARRPKNANNLETLGLVKIVYPALDSITEEDLRVGCREWGTLGLNLDDWKSYLKIILDFYVRENTLIDIHSYQVNWMGGKLFARLLQGPEFEGKSEEEKKAIWAFPSVNKGNQHKLVRMLELFSKRSAKDNPELFNGILRFAWRTLINKEILQHYKDGNKEWREGYHLKLSNSASFELITNASVCPITNRWLDTSFRGISPYLTSKTEIEDCLVKNTNCKIPHPAPDLLQSNSSQSLRNWIRHNEFILNMKKQGIWRDITDAALLPPVMLRSAEHSAQQYTDNLKLFEKAFKKDFLNVLNCSTTMEMGVDIGSLVMVAMNNAPPSTANYLQRAGRAGRRGESTSIVFTFCKSTPHGERIFANPKWPFETPIPVPKVALESVTIVHRHINAFLLSRYLNTKFSKENLPTLKSGKFFTSDTGTAIYERFMSWLSSEAVDDKYISQCLRMMIVGSGLAGQAEASLVHKTLQAIEEASSHWRRRWDSLCAEIQKVSEDDTGAKRRLIKQKESMEKDSLLSELTSRGFLPGYGFPVNVVELVTNNKMEKAKEAHSYPSRGLATAIREFSPGSDIVLNGAVYRSMGLQLSWKVPQSQYDLSKVQKLRNAVSCQECGFCQLDIISNQELKSCPDCGSNRLKTMEYIVPDGFKVDYKTPLHNDYTQPLYAPYTEPLISITDTTWQALCRHELGRFKVSDAAELFYYNNGNGGGYALCWSCGRMEPLAVNSSEGRTFLDLKSQVRLLTREKHPRLSGTSIDGNADCIKSDWSIKVSSSSLQDGLLQIPFVLGFSSVTSMFELQIRDPKTHEWIFDRKLLFSFGAALRQVYCARKGISTSELGISVHQRKTASSESESVCSLFIFDTAEQGAGYASSIPEVLAELFKDVYEYASECPSACDAYCHACLLDYDTQHHVEYLDRKWLVQFFEETKFHLLFEVEPSRACFGERSIPELSSIDQLLSIKGRSSLGIDLFVSASDWDLAEVSVLSKLHDLKGIPIRLLLGNAAIQTLTPNLAWQLRSKIPSQVEISSYELPKEISAGSFPLLRMKFTDGDYWYATDDQRKISCNAQWGSSEGASLVAAKPMAVDLKTSPFNLEDLALKSELTSNIALIDDITTKLNVPFNRFGSSIFALFEEIIPRFKNVFDQGIENVTYTDRYLISPISLGLIISIFAHVKAIMGIRDFEIITCHPSAAGDRKPYCIADNFSNIDEVNDFIDSVCSTYGINVYPEFASKNDIDHGRCLTFTLKNGEVVRFLFDQGMGYWATRRPYSRIKFDFESVGAFDINSWCFKVESSGGNSYIVVHKGRSC